MGKFLKKILGLLTSRLLIVGLVMIFQFLWTWIIVDQIAERVKYVNEILFVFSVIMVLVIMLKDINPAYKIAWVIVIFIMPIFGGFLYLLIGNKRPTKNMQQKMKGALESSNTFLNQDKQVLRALEEEDMGVANQSYYIQKWANYPIYKNTDTQYYEMGEDYFEALKEELNKAGHYIFMEYFIIARGEMWDSILEILKEKAAQGVDVRVLYDDMGCIGLLPFEYTRQLESMGIKAEAFNRFVPFVSMVVNHRDHRKIVVIDGHVAFTGGINLADEYINKKERFGHWKDTGIRIRGDAVYSFTIMFLQMWDAQRGKLSRYESYLPERYMQSVTEEDGFVQPYGDSPLDDEGVGEGIYLNMICAAKKYVYIFTPYLIIGDEMVKALCLAAKRGVDVRIVVPHIPDKKIVFILTKSYYPPLVAAGIKVYEYEPGFLHAKCFVSDDKVATVGTVNMDYRSLFLHFECGVFLYRSKAVLQVKKDFEETMQKSILITKEKCNASLPIYLFQGLLRIFAPML